MAIYQSGNINTTALIVPGVDVIIVPPQNIVINGVPTNTMGVVGTAQYGPVGVATTVGSMAEFVANFGYLQNRRYDMGTQVATAILQGAQNFVCVRVTDGTDVAASGIILTSCLILTSRYTGTLGNSITATVGTGSAASSFSLTISIPGTPPEIYNNLTGSGNAFWLNAAAAINSGQSTLRGASQIVVATAGAGTTAPSLATYTLSGGTDGATPANANVLDTTLVGSDSLPRKGMYVLRGQGCSVAVLADTDGSTSGMTSNTNTWSVQEAFGLSEGIYMVCNTPAGDTIANAITEKNTAGIDTYAVKLMLGDFLYWADPVNSVTRLVSPSGFVAGRMSNLSPQNSTLNKALYGIVGSQKAGVVGSAQTQVYTQADLQTLIAAGLDVVANPAPGGFYWSTQSGHNASSSASIHGDNYTRMTNFLATTFNAAMGIYIGAVINAGLFQQVAATFNTFLNALLQQGLLGTLDGSLPYSVTCNPTNNPQSRTALGYLQVDVQVQYQGIVEFFLVNLEGGTTVVISKSNNLSS